MPDSKQMTRLCDCEDRRAATAHLKAPCTDCEAQERMPGFMVCETCWDEMARQEPPWVSAQEALHQ